MPVLANIIGPELLIVLAVVAVLFGGSRLPQLARSLGSAKNEFERGLEGSDERGPEHEAAILMPWPPLASAGCRPSCSPWSCRGSRWLTVVVTLNVTSDNTGSVATGASKGAKAPRSRSRTSSSHPSRSW